MPDSILNYPEYTDIPDDPTEKVQKFFLEIKNMLSDYFDANKDDIITKMQNTQTVTNNETYKNGIDDFLNSLSDNSQIEQMKAFLENVEIVEGIPQTNIPSPNLKIFVMPATVYRNRNKSSLGIFNPLANRIDLPDNFTKNTLLHELAHALLFNFSAIFLNQFALTSQQVDQIKSHIGIILNRDINIFDNYSILYMRDINSALKLGEDGESFYNDLIASDYIFGVDGKKELISRVRDRNRETQESLNNSTREIDYITENYIRMSHSFYKLQNTSGSKQPLRKELKRQLARLQESIPIIDGLDIIKKDLLIGQLTTLTEKKISQITQSEIDDILQIFRDISAQLDIERNFLAQKIFAGIRLVQMKYIQNLDNENMQYFDYWENNLIKNSSAIGYGYMNSIEIQARFWTMRMKLLDAGVIENFGEDINYDILEQYLKDNINDLHIDLFKGLELNSDLEFSDEDKEYIKMIINLNDNYIVENYNSYPNTVIG